MKISQLKNCISKWLNVEGLIPLMIWGPPGVGKSSIIREISKERGLALIDLRVSLLEPVDLMGLPSIEQGVTKWNTPVFLPQDKSSQGILFLDEINLGSREILKSLYQLILDRRIGSYELPKGWKIIGAGNRAVDGAFVSPMPRPLLNRFIHLEVEVSPEDFCHYLLKKEGSEHVVSYILWRPDSLYIKSASTEAAFPTPRSWEQVSHVLKIEEESQEKWELISGLISPQISSELREYIKVSKEVKPKELLQSPERFQQLERSLMFAGLLAVLNCKEPTAKKVEFLRKISPEFGVLGMKLLFQKEGTKLLQVPGVKEWASEVKDLLF